MANPSMVPPGPGMVGQPMLPGSSGQMHPRVQRPPSQTGLDFFFFCISYDLMTKVKQITAIAEQ